MSTNIKQLQSKLSSARRQIRRLNKEIVRLRAVERAAIKWGSKPSKPITKAELVESLAADIGLVMALPGYRGPKPTPREGA